MADGIALTPGAGVTASTEEITTLHGAGVTARHVQHVQILLRTSDAVAVDLPADVTNGIDVDVTRSVLPTGAATATLQGTVTETAPSTDTASSGLNGRLQRIAQRLTSLIALLPPALIGGRLDVNIGAMGGVVLSNTTWKYTPPAAGLISTAGITAKTAAGAGVRNYVQAVQIINSHQTVSTEVLIRDGAAGTVLHRGWAQAAGGGFVAQFDPPLFGTANTLIEIGEVTATPTAGVLVNLQGYTAA